MFSFDADKNATKRQIIDALFALMHEKNFADIKITEIIGVAKVSRSSFYRNFSSKEGVLSGLIDWVLRDFRGDRDFDAIDCMTYEHVKSCFSCFKNYGSYVLDLYHSQFATMLLDELNKFHESVAGSMSAKSVTKYSVYTYMGAMFNTAVNWLEHGATESVEDVAAVFCESFGIEAANTDSKN